MVFTPRGVAQSGSALGWGPSGRRFKSCLPDRPIERLAGYALVVSDPRVWMVTGASSGFGRAIASAALERGDRVVATARRSESVSDLGDSMLALSLDVTD